MPENSAFYNSDGDFLIVAQEGVLHITTELGKLNVNPKEICVIPRGIRFRVDVSANCRGYISEIFKGHFTLPELGVIGSNGLANPRDFEIPVACFEDKDCDFTVVNKFHGKFFSCQYKSSVFNTVAWHGNYYPFKYHLDKFNTIGTISFDHPDPSIFTVLTAPSDEKGYLSFLKFIIFVFNYLRIKFLIFSELLFVTSLFSLPDGLLEKIPSGLLIIIETL